MSAVLRKYQPREIHARAPRIDWEGNEQTILFTWIDLQYPCESKLIYHVPNGGHRHKATAGKLKGQGVRAGMPDINVDIARGGYFGMRIEFKATPPNDSPISPKQRDALQLLNERGYLAILCRGVHDAQEQIRAYLRLPATEARP